MDNLIVAPSTDPIKNVSEIIEYARSLQHCADFLHCDIMDGKFVETKTYTYKGLKEVNQRTTMPLDVHLMVESPSKCIKDYLLAGANILTIHFEAYKNKKLLVRDLKYIRKKKALAGLSIKPSTLVADILPYLCFVDVILVMSVEPGKSGQEFIEDIYKKIVELSKVKNDYKLDIKIEVDGGITPPISQKLKMFGADMVVSGSYVFNSDNKELAIDELR